MRPRLYRDRDHLVGCCHLEIERLCDLGFEAGHILVADMTAVLAQMCGDPIGASFDGNPSCAHRVGMHTAAGVADGRYVIDIDAEADVGNRRQAIASSWSALASQLLTHSRARPGPPRPWPATGR